jgi:hypothetical protein
MDGAWIMKVDILSNDDDWIAIYVDGALHYEGHSIPGFVWRRLLEAAGASVARYYNQFEAFGRGPETLAEALNEERLVDGC